MWNSDEVFPPRNRLYTPPSAPLSRTPFPSKPWMSDKKPRNPPPFHVINKIPQGFSPYVVAKHVQMVEKDPGKAVSMFWSAINSGDRVDSALKDMAAVMKQLNRPDEAIEAIKSFRHLCPAESQESIDNVLVELYKRSGRLEEEIEVLLIKLKRLEEARSFYGKIRMGRSNGKKICVRPQQEYARLLGNLAWAYLQLNEYRTAEEYYRKALSIEPDRNKQCNLAICLMGMNNITEAKFLLQSIQASAFEGKMDESYGKSYERASELLAEIESQSEDGKENCCVNVGVFAFTPYKSRRGVGSADTVLGNDTRYSWETTCTPPIQPRKIPRSPLTQPKRDSGHASCNWLTTHTPPIPAEKFLLSPFTQSRTDSGQSDTDYWRKGTHRNEAMSQIPRRLQFEKPAESDFHMPTGLNSRYREAHHQRSINLNDSRTDSRLSDTDNWRKGTHMNEAVSQVPRRLQFDKPAASDFHLPTGLNSRYREAHQQRSMNLTGSRTMADTNPKENATENDCAGTLVDHGCDSASYKGRRCWADIAEEEEEEQQKKNSLPAEFCRLEIM